MSTPARSTFFSRPALRSLLSGPFKRHRRVRDRVKSHIRVCSDWDDAHSRPVYTLSGRCPDCGADAINSAPAPFNPEDPYGEHRRALKRRVRE